MFSSACFAVVIKSLFYSIHLVNGSSQNSRDKQLSKRKGSVHCSHFTKTILIRRGRTENGMSVASHKPLQHLT